MNAERPAWVGFGIDLVAIVAAVVLVVLGTVTGREALGWIALVQSGRLYVWASRARRKGPSESGLLLLFLAAADVARHLFAREHLPHS